MEQNELRVMYNKRLEREKQCYISKQVQIDSSLLSRKQVRLIFIRIYLRD